jgi:hypothetical protein
MGERRVAYRVLAGKPERGYLEDSSLNGKITLR